MPLNKDQLEGKYCNRRIAELKDNPIQGNFDTKHLLAINEYIFQDLPRAGFSEYRPGKFRKAVDKNFDWIKVRKLESINMQSTVAYSTMNKDAINKLEEILTNSPPEKFQNLSLDKFAEKIGELYVNLDYVHPFDDGNSRTLRYFTGQVAKEAGYDIDWDIFASQSKGRDLLYIARDLSVNELAEPNLKHIASQRSVFLTQSQFGENRKLPDLLKDAVAYKDLSVNISRELESILDESMKGSKNTEHEKNIIKSEVVKSLVEAEKNQQINLEKSLTKTKPELIKMVKKLTNPKKIEKNKNIDLERYPPHLITKEINYVRKRRS